MSKKVIENLKKLQAELDRLHHNATPDYIGPLDDFTSDLFDSEFSFACELAFSELAQDFSELNKKYGPFYQYGRGGRTVAPSKLILDSRYSHAIKAIYLDIDDEESQWLTEELKKFNDYVINWNKLTPKSILEFIKEEYADQIAENKGKKRHIKTVVDYK